MYSNGRIWFRLDTYWPALTYIPAFLLHNLSRRYAERACTWTHQRSNCNNIQPQRTCLCNVDYPPQFLEESICSQMKPERRSFNCVSSENPKWSMMITLTSKMSEISVIEKRMSHHFDFFFGTFFQQKFAMISLHLNLKKASYRLKVMRSQQLVHLNIALLLRVLIHQLQSWQIFLLGSISDGKVWGYCQWKIALQCAFCHEI